MTMHDKPVICFITGSHGDWGGASRVIYTNLRALDRNRLTPLVLLPETGPIVPELQRLGIRHAIWGRVEEPGRLTAYAKRFLKSLQFFRKNRVALVHVNLGFWRPAELLAARMLGIPILAHYHLVNSEPSPFVRLCRAVICISRYTAEHSLPKKMEKPVIYNPVSLDRFDHGVSLRQELGLEKEHIVVSFLGQIRTIKGIQDFIEMAKRITAPQARFLIAGECRDPIIHHGSYTREQLMEMISSDSRIQYLGYITEVQDIYQTSDIIVVPSRWQEPLGLINLEAGACRKPVVATRVGGIPEVVHDGINGYLVEPGDIDALAKKVGVLIDDRSLSKAMGEAGRRQVEQRFTAQATRQFEELLLSYCSQ